MSMCGYDRIHQWEHDLRNVLDDMLKVVEEGKGLGYFDALIDIETHCNLIKMLRNKYIDQHNEGFYTENPDVKKRVLANYTKDDINKESRGGYSVDYVKRLDKVLT